VVAALAAGRQASGTRPVAVNTATGEILDDDEQAPGTPAVAPEGGQE
jgi:hypothetical protein